MDTIAPYLPQDRRQALARGVTLPDRTAGAVLFADISGFTPLTEGLAQTLGPRRGAEALSRQLDTVYDALIAEVDRYGGSVISFSGDAITCWFDDTEGTMGTEGSAGTEPVPPVPVVPEFRAVACALALQQAMAQFATIALPNGTTTALALKVAVASGVARRFVVGDPAIQLLDALAGATIARTASAEHLAQPGEVLVDSPTAAALGDALQIAEWREDHDTHERFAIVTALRITDVKLQIDEMPEQSTIYNLQSAILRPWLLPAVYEREQSGQGTFLTEFRPAVALFLRFAGLDYDDDAAEGQLDTFIRRAQAVLERYDGALLALTIGDKGSYFYAAFGAPTAHEDDARRAVKAALELRDAAATLGFLAPVQIGLSRGTMRAGAYGGTTRRTYGVLGDDVNLAARLMVQAVPGEVLISGRVQAAIAGHFSCEPRPPIPLKGKAEPLPVFAVSGAHQRRAIRLQEPTYALPMIGRQHELAAIEEKLSLALQGHGQIVGITAEAGMGKSRLVAEVIRLARRRNFIGYGGACQSDGVNTSYLVWRSIWSAFFDLDPAAPLRKQIRALEGEIEDLAPERAEALPLLGKVLGLPLPDNDFTRTLEPQFRKSALEALLLDCLKATAREVAEDGGSLLLVLEDLHWIDPASHDLLEEVARTSPTLPVLIVLAYRPPEPHRLQALAVESLPHFTKITLTELSTAEAEQAIRAKLAQLFPERGGAVPPALVARLTARAQGNPFYLEELLNYLHDRGLDPRDVAALDQIELPDSLHSLILSRIDQLTAQQQLTLKVASIIGRQFGFEQLRGYYPALSESEPLKADLDTLATLELTPLDTPEPELAYLFKHIVTHEVAYESLAYATRAALHEQYARFVEAQAGDARHPYLDLLAYHYDHTENLPKRREYLRRAGEAAQAAYANAAALDYYERLLPLLTEASEQIEICLKAGVVLQLTGRWPEAEARYREALIWAEQAHDPAARARCQHTLGVLARQRGEYDTARAWLEQARAEWVALGDRAGLSQVLIETAMVFYRQGEQAVATQQWEDVLALARELGDTPGTARALSGLGAVARAEGDYTAAGALYEESLALWRDIGDKRGIALSLHDLGDMTSQQGDYTAAGALYEESLALLRDIGDKRGIALSLNNLGLVASDQGDYVTAGALYEESLALHRTMGGKWGIAVSLNNLGSVAYSQGDYVTARALYEESLALRRTTGDKWGIALPLSNLGNVAYSQGDYVTARALYEEALGLLRDISYKQGIAEIAHSLGQLAWAEGQLDQAQTFFGDSLAQYHRLGDKRSVAHCLAGLALVAADRSIGAQGVPFAQHAAQLGGATTALLESLKVPLELPVGLPYERAIATVRATLGDEAFDAAWEAGRQMPLEEAVAFALAP